MSNLKTKTPVGFEAPTELPASSDNTASWQNSNRSWWENNPMRYDWRDQIPYPEFSKEFYQEIDQRFFDDAEKYLPTNSIPFDQLINFETITDQNVLEIGVGNGSHAQLLAEHAKSYTGIDITNYAVKSTSTRFKVFGLNGTVQQMDAEKMDFPDNSFDFIWTWGVIHHSADTESIIRQMHRVLRPGGRAIVMVYYRSIWDYYIVNGFFRGVLKGDLLKTRSLHKTVQRGTDGAIARFYSFYEWRKLVSVKFSITKMYTTVNKAALFPLPGGKIKDAIVNSVPDSVTRFLSRQCRFGAFLISELVKR